MNTTKATKIQKGFYKLDYAGHIFYIAHDKDIEGENKWNVWSDTICVDEYMDTLWHTKTEAVFMIAYEFQTEE